MSEYLKREDVRKAVLHNEGDAVIAAIDYTTRLILPDWFCGDGKRKEGTE